MSRGWGWRQRRAVELLAATKRARDEGLTFAELRPALGKDRANAIRALSSLVARGDLERVANPEATEQPRYKLNWLALCSVMMKREPPDYELEEAREHWREVDAALHDIRARQQEKRRALAAREDLWEKPGRSFERRRSPGPNQTRVIAALVRYADDPQMGLPVAAVRRIARIGADKANVLRAVRSLVRSGLLQRSRDGERLRLAAWESAWWRWRATPYTLDPPLDDAKAKSALEAFGEPGGVSPRGDTPWQVEKISEPR
jgi:DNA-binding MarR family transcriptional regulator